MASHVLGISAFYHDSAACLLRDGEIAAAAEEERFSRRKGDARFPREAVAYCLAEAGIGPPQLDAVAYYDKPLQTVSRVLQSCLEYPLRSFRTFSASAPVLFQEKLRIPRLIDEHLPGFSGPLYFTRHHEAHAASAFFCSPFESAAVLVADGVGEWACTSLGHGQGTELRLLQEVQFPHSLGLFYSAITQYLGFQVNLDEYKVMGLAPYGEPRLAGRMLAELIDLKADGSLALNLAYFDYPHSLRMIGERLGRFLGRPARGAEAALEPFHMDVAASAQAIATEAMVRLARTAQKLTGERQLCLAGGVALNCVANGAIYREKLFDDLYIQPAAGDAGGAIGAALQVWHQVRGEPRPEPPRDRMRGAYLGPSICGEAAGAFLEAQGVDYLRLERDQLASRLARWIAAGYVVGLCHGRMEFGPRALGARSILGDPRDPRSQSRINRKVKYRESFRPFAPAILEERVGEFFDLEIPSPYMLLVMPLRDQRRLNRGRNAEAAGLGKLRVVRSEVPAVTHVDYSVRLQTLTPERNPLLYAVVEEFHRLTGCPMVVNTSFNVRGEPIVCDHQDAYRCFRMTDLDILVLDCCAVAKPGVDLDAPIRAFAPPAPEEAP
jgi:carbamoyltransferase